MLDFGNNIDELVFEAKNKEYGAYRLRKAYPQVVGFSLFTAFSVFILFLVFFQYYCLKRSYENVYGNEPTAVYELMNPRYFVKMPHISKIKNLNNSSSKNTKKNNTRKYNNSIIADSIPHPIIEKNISRSTTKDSLSTDSVNLSQHVDNLISETNKDAIFFLTDEMPQFPGGQVAITEFIAKHLKLPEKASRNKIYGTVYVAFCVTDSGTVSKIHLASGFYPELDEEALRIVELMPKWQPGIYQGKTVNVWQTLPIEFVPEN